MVPGDESTPFLLFSVATHVFVEPFTPPLPLLLCLIAAGLAILLSFILAAFFASNPLAFSDYPKINLLRWKAARFVYHPRTRLPIKVVSVLLFALLVTAGFIGTSDPIYNLAPTFIWVIWWVGVAYVSAFLGDIWSLLNPWKILFGWIEQLWLRLRPGAPFTPILKYPSSLGVWPALLLFLAFAWVENVYSGAVTPSRISQMVVVYSLITWFGMVLVGKDLWLRNGEAFSVAFGYLARFAPIETQAISQPSKNPLEGMGHDTHIRESGSIQSTLNLRPFAAGLLNMEPASISKMLFVLLLLATVTFDGFTSTLPWINIHAFLKVHLANDTAIGTLGLAATMLIFATLYLCFSALMNLATGIKLGALSLANAFVYTLIPIALAYHLAHFLLFLLIQGQLLVPLSSDPFGFGWDLFGTAGYRLNFGLVGPTVYWLISLIAIVGGHIIAVFLGHTVAFRLFGSGSLALRSQIPMLILMIGYTIASLWIITQPMYMA